MFSVADRFQLVQVPEVWITELLKVFRKIQVSVLYNFLSRQDSLYFVNCREIDVRVWGIVSVIK